MQRRQAPRRTVVVPLDQALKATLEERGMSMRGAAEAMGVSHTNVGNWIGGVKVRHRFFLPQIATFLGATLPEAEAMRAEMARLKQGGRRVREPIHG